MQWLLRWMEWDSDGACDGLQDYVIEHLGGPDGVLIVDAGGFLKKGIRSAGVQRQYSGTVGRSRYALIDRELDLAEPWISDQHRWRRARIPDGTDFERKPQQAMGTLARARSGWACFSRG
jgi:hypothetical protein